MGAYCRGKERRPCGEAEATLGRLGVADLAEPPLPELSGGEKQLVVLAQALMQQGRACCCSTSRPRPSTCRISCACSTCCGSSTPRG